MRAFWIEIRKQTSFGNVQIQTLGNIRFPRIPLNSCLVGFYFHVRIKLIVLISLFVWKYRLTSILFGKVFI